LARAAPEGFYLAGAGADKGRQKRARLSMPGPDPLDILRLSGEIGTPRLIRPGKECTEDETMLGELLKDMAHSTTQGTVGVSLIFIYLAWIITVALIRIKQGKAEGHH
jgi:hypothetical protein